MKRTENSMFTGMREILEPLYTVVGMLNGAAIQETVCRFLR